MKITNKEALKYFMYLQQVGHLSGPERKLIYARSKNINMLTPIFKKGIAFEIMEDKSDAVILYEAEKGVIVKEYVKHDPSGRAQETSDGYVFINSDMEDKYNEALNDLNKKHPVAKAELDAHEQNRKDWMGEEITFSPHMIDEQYLPENISGDEYEAISFMVKVNE